MIDSKTNGLDTPDTNAPEDLTQEPELAPTPDCSDAESKTQSLDKPKEMGGRAGPDPTRFGDWEKNGRCVDF